jgi:DNA uptake protein ComE-like DNA-binding protein
MREMKTIPGIGDAYAKKIVDGRPYKRKDEGREGRTTRSRIRS